jgi:hypothetical protein
MIAKLLALFQNRPATRKEELMVEALRRETRVEHHGDRHANDAEEGVQDIMSTIAAHQAEPSSPESPARSYLAPTFGALATMVMVLLVFISLSKKEKSVSPLREQTNLIETPGSEAYPNNPSVESLPEESLNALREVAYAFPLAVEATRLKRDVRRGTDSLLAIVVPLRELVKTTPSLSVPALPSFQNTPYQTELDNLRQDTKQVIDFIEKKHFRFSMDSLAVIHPFAMKERLPKD